MQRNTAIAVGLLFALSVTLVVVLGKSRRIPEHAARTATGSAQPSASAPASVSPSSSSPAPSAPADEGTSGEAFDLLPDGRRAPELPASAPKQVGFGVVVVSYQGAQAAPKEAPAKSEAKRKAQGLVEEATRDFPAAVKKGDRGSTTDAGNVPRDVLEPAIEYALFSLKPGEVYPGPIDTPRGFWIVRRSK
jgi:parvulin-like peptidyl-prolyl isomerase